jgi:hypothetical protein
MIGFGLIARYRKGFSGEKPAYGLPKRVGEVIFVADNKPPFNQAK